MKCNMCDDGDVQHIIQSLQYCNILNPVITIIIILVSSYEILCKILVLRQKITQLPGIKL